MGEVNDRHILAALVRVLGDDCPALSAEDLIETDAGKLHVYLEPNRGAILLRYRGHGHVRDLGINGIGRAHTQPTLPLPDLEDPFAGPDPYSRIKPKDDPDHPDGWHPHHGQYMWRLWRDGWIVHTVTMEAWDDFLRYLRTPTGRREQRAAGWPDPPGIGPDPLP